MTVFKFNWKAMIIYGVLVLFLQTANFFGRFLLNYSINGALLFGYLGNNMLAIIVILLALIFLLLFYRQNKTDALFLLPALAGATSNLIDRLWFGGAIDYINFSKIPTFNPADALIVTSAVSFAITGIYKLLIPQEKRPPKT